MKRLIILLLLFSFTTLYACSLCITSVPTINTMVKKSVNDKNTTFYITWNFDKDFTNQILENYPKKYDIQFKLQEAQKVIELYMSENLYLTHIKSDKQKYIIKSINNPKLKLNGTLFRFQYDVTINTTDKLNIEFLDYQNYFLFNFNDKNIVDISKKKQIDLMDSFGNYINEIKLKLKSLLNDINEEGNFSSYIWLLLFSFLYGVIHAIGPGHGKSIVGAYFLKDNYSVSKALGISSAIGIVHTFSAFLLTVLVYFILNNLLSKFLLDVEAMAIKISAVTIILIALYLIYKKFMHKNCACGSCQSKNEPTSVAVVLAVGTVPCPGTVTIFIFTFSLGIYSLGFLSAIFMSIGMSFIIFLTAYMSIKVRTQFNKNEKVIKFFEYGSLFFILIMGLFLFFV